MPQRPTTDTTVAPATEPARSKKFIRLFRFCDGNCSETTAHKWIQQGRLRSYKVGRMTFVDETFEEFVERMDAEQAATEAAEQATAPPKQPPAERGDGTDPKLTREAAAPAPATPARKRGRPRKAPAADVASRPRGRPPIIVRAASAVPAFD